MDDEEAMLVGLADRKLMLSTTNLQPYCLIVVVSVTLVLTPLTVIISETSTGLSKVKVSRVPSKYRGRLINLPNSS